MAGLDGADTGSGFDVLAIRVPFVTAGLGGLTLGMV
jgi:hypothetical protein